MKKYFAIAFIVLVVLLLVLRKQTEPTAFVAPKVVSEPPVAAPTPIPVATPIAVSQPAPVANTSAPSALTLSPEAIEEIRQEVKAAAAGGYTAERAFQAEWDRFSSDIVYTGWAPESPDLNYKFGFLGAYEVPPVDSREKPQRFSTDAFINEETYESSQKIRYTPAAEKIRLSDYARYCERGCVATKDGFELLVAVPLDDQGHVDVWTMNEKKELKQVVDGTK